MKIRKPNANTKADETKPKNIIRLFITLSSFRLMAKIVIK